MAGATVSLVVVVVALPLGLPTPSVSKTVAVSVPSLRLDRSRSFVHVPDPTVAVSVPGAVPALPASSTLIDTVAPFSPEPDSATTWSAAVTGPSNSTFDGAAGAPVSLVVVVV